MLNDSTEGINGPNDSDYQPLLEQPELFLPALASSIQDELAFFTHDMRGFITYLSDSCVQVLNQDRERWIGRHLFEVLTDNPCNDALRAEDWQSLQENSTKSRICEVFDRTGRALPVQLWRVPIRRLGVPVGYSGLMRRIDFAHELAGPKRMLDDSALMARVAQLSEVERQVVDLVVDGHMNKKMALMLDVAVRTIESRRARAMAKLQARSLPDLVQIWMRVRGIEARRD